MNPKQRSEQGRSRRAFFSLTRAPRVMTHEFSVRILQADAEDAEEFLKLEAACFEMEFSLNTLYYWRPIIDYCWAFKAISRRRIIGGAIAMPTRDGKIYINSLFVHSRFRKGGIGTRLLSRILRLRPCLGFVLDVKSERSFLHEFYRGHGFENTRRVQNYYLDGTTRIVMTRRPSPSPLDE